MRRGAGGGRSLARHGRRGAVEPLPDDRGRRRRARPRRPPRAVRRSSARLDGQPAPLGAVRRPAPLRRLPADTTGASWRSPASSSTAELAADGCAPLDPDRRQHGDRRAGYAAAYVELIDQCEPPASRPRPSCSRRRVAAPTPGSSPAGRCARRSATRDAPAVLAIGVAKGVVAGRPDVAALAGDALGAARCRRGVGVDDDDVEIDDRWLGDDYAVPTRAGDEAIVWAARTVAGCSTAPTPARGSPACSATPPPAAGVRRRRRVHPHGRHPRRVHDRRIAVAAAVRLAFTSVAPVSEILEVDMLAFERGDRNQRKAVVDGVRRSLETGFVLTRHDLSEDLLDTAYAMLQQFFAAPTEEKQRWTVAGRPRPDGVHRRARRDGGVERHAGLEGDAQLVDADRARPPAEAQVPAGLSGPGAARGDRARDHQGALRVPRHDRRAAAPLPAHHRRGHRLPRDVLRRDGRRRPDADPGDPLPTDGRVTRRRRQRPLRVGRRARRHQPDHRPAAGHGAGAAGQGRRRAGSTPSRPTAR